MDPAADADAEIVGVGAADVAVIRTSVKPACVSPSAKFWNC